MKISKSLLPTILFVLNSFYGFSQLGVIPDFLNGSEYKVIVPISDLQGIDISQLTFTLTDNITKSQILLSSKTKVESNSVEFTFHLEKLGSPNDEFKITSNLLKETNVFKLKTMVFTITASPNSTPVFINSDLKFILNTTVGDPKINDEQLWVVLDGRTIKPNATSRVGNGISITIQIPDDHSTIGDNKQLKLIYYSEKFNSTRELVSIGAGIVGKPPIISEIRTTVYYEDEPDYQTLDFIVSNFNSIESITLVPSTVKIKGTSTNTININSGYVRYDHQTSLVSIDYRGANLDKIQITYREHNGTDIPFVIQTKLAQPIEVGCTFTSTKKYQTEALALTPPAVFEDDLIDVGTSPTFTFEKKTPIVVPPGLTAVNTTIKLDPNSFETVVLMPVGSKTGNFKITTNLLPSTYKVDLFTNNNPAVRLAQGALIVRPKPLINNIYVDFRGNINTEIFPFSNPVRPYQLIVEGLSLDDPSLRFYLSGNGNRIPLDRIINRSNNYVTLEMYNPQRSRPEDFTVGDYRLLVERLKANGTVGVYPFETRSISIKPKRQPSDKLSLSFINEGWVKKGGDWITRDDFSLSLDANPVTPDYDVQKFRITITQFDYNGVKVKDKIITESGNETIELATRSFSGGVRIRSYDILKQLDIDRLQPFNRIRVKVEKTSQEEIPAPSVFNFYSKGKGFDKFGIVLSAPPFLVAMRSVKAKVQEAGTNQVKYEGDERLVVQTLLVNAGVGFKWIPRKSKEEDRYEPSPWNIGFYLLGLDFANAQSKTDQINDIKTNDFIARGSFNFLLLGELNLINLSSLNVRIPVNFGPLFIIDPLDNRANIAFAFGLGIDIPLLAGQAKK
jgi:hypothetical protein